MKGEKKEKLFFLQPSFSRDIKKYLQFIIIHRR